MALWLATIHRLPGFDACCEVATTAHSVGMNTVYLIRIQLSSTLCNFLAFYLGNGYNLSLIEGAKCSPKSPRKPKKL